MAKRINEVEKVTTMNNDAYVLLNTADGDTVQIRKVDLANALADVMRTATAENKGLMPAGVYAQSHNTASTLIVNFKNIPITAGLLIAASHSSGNSMSLYFMSINRTSGVYTKPSIGLYQLAGSSLPNKFKIKNNDVTGEFSIYFERLMYTPVIKIFQLGSIGNNFLLSMTPVTNEDDLSEAVEIPLKK